MRWCRFPGVTGAGIAAFSCREMSITATKFYRRMTGEVIHSRDLELQTCFPLANKLARIAWSVLARGRGFEASTINDTATQPA
jgi:hypothetical protein